MHCDQCGKENRTGSKFCRFCGHSLAQGVDSSSAKNKGINLTWKNQNIRLFTGLVILVGLIYGTSNVYAYYQVESKIGSAFKSQSLGRYAESRDSLNGWEDKTFTKGQKIRIQSIKADDERFIGFKVAFDAAVSIENATSTKSVSVSETLQSALKSLKSIDASYPDFQNVQAEITKIQNALVVSLQDEASMSKKAAADAYALAQKNQAAAIAAQSAKARAEENAQKAQSDADAATASAEANRVLEVKKSFVNQLNTSYNTFINDARPTYDKAILNLNAGNNYTAITLFGQVKATDSSVYKVAMDLLTNFSNMPKEYTDAAYALGEASLYEDKASDSAMDSISITYDNSATTNYNSSQSTYYIKQVYAFLNN